MNVSKGDLAIVVGAENPENLKKVCEVLEFVGQCTYQDGSTVSDAWIVKFSSRIKGRLVDEEAGVVKYIWAPAGEPVHFSDACLRRICGPLADFEEERDVGMEIAH